MIVASLAMLAVMGVAPGADPSSLVDRLGSPRYADREQAAAALEDLGRVARPALRLGLTAGDPEIRSRSAALLDKIDNNLMTRPTLVTLDFDDRPLDEVIRTIGARSEVSMTLEAGNIPEWSSRRITLREPEPVPFWKAIDRLCEVAGLQYNPASIAGGIGRGPAFQLYPGPIASGPSSDSGPFRVNLVSVHLQRDVMLARQPAHASPPAFPPLGNLGRGAVPALAGVAAPSPVHEQFFVQMQVLAEPRLLIPQSHELKLIEARDDRDQSLILPADGPNGQVQRYSAYSGYGSSPVILLPIHLRRPEQPGRVIKELRGVLPVTVGIRKPDPLSVTLGDAALGKPVRNDDAELTLLGVSADANSHRTKIELGLRSFDEEGGPAAGLGAMGGPLHGPISMQNQVEILDDRGNPLPSFSASRAPGQDGEARLILNVMTPPGSGTPAEVRYYGITQALTEVSFEFSDIPMP